VDVNPITNVRLRSYNVGFGDAFLMTISYAAGKARHVLIDFGSTAMGKGPQDMVQIAETIAEDCDGKLEVVVATHRHADHISGFGGAAGKIIAGLKPDVVVQPWTEDPALDPKATAPRRASAGRAQAGRAQALGLTTSLASMQSLAASAAAEGAVLAASDRLPASVAEKVRFLGETNLSNRAAVENLASMGPNVYAKFGTKLRLRQVLPGVRVDVLGPPTLDDAPGIASMASKDAQEYWHLAASRAVRTSTGAAAPLFPDRDRIDPPQEAKWVVPQVDRAHADEMVGILRVLDDVLNNTSLILLFDIGGTLLLFPGDAQIENWRHALFNAADAADIRARLAKTTVYKVGHHGSLNATPRTLWNSFEHKSEDETAPGRLTTMVSTKAGKHGDARAHTEVPRQTLVAALRKESRFITTDGMRSTRTFWRDVDIPIPPAGGGG
jgi:hypothetical protein